MSDVQLSEPARVTYIDVLKGIACLLILIIHASVPRLGELPTPDRVVLTFIFASTHLFFFTSGMNVVNFIGRYETNREFRMTRFYLAAAVLLFVLSICYSVNRGSMRLPQIFQGIAVCTAFTYICLRFRLPNWALALLAMLLYGLWLVFWQRQAPVLADMRLLNFPDELKRFDQWSRTLPWVIRFLFFHFSLLPWVSCSLLGAATYRSLSTNPAGIKWWAAFYLLLPILGALSRLAPGLEQPLLLQSFADMMLRNFPFAFGIWVGAVGLLVLAMARRHHGGQGAVGHFLQFVGRESFLFLVWHWVFLTIFFPVGQLGPLAGGRPGAYLPMILASAVVYPTLPWAVRLGERWRRRTHFAGEALAVLIIGTLPGVLAFLTRGLIPLPRMLLSFPACLAFAYLYPELRRSLRRRCTASEVA